jgi:uncharacterized protein (DUF849 family)
VTTPENIRNSQKLRKKLQMPMVAQAMILGGNVRVGLEDNLYLEKGVLASNGQ